MNTITITVEQFNAIKRLSDFADFYIDDLEPSNPVYESDKEDIRAGQEVIAEIDRVLMMPIADIVFCPHCAYAADINGLIGEDTNDCPKCGKQILTGE